MTRTILAFYFICISFSIFSQETIRATLMHDGAEREFIIYVPDSYTSETPAPIVFNFHGYGSNADEQIFYGEFRPQADQNGFILIVPQGLPLNGINHFNVGGFTFGSTVDDVGFTGAMIDYLIDNYEIDEKRIYSTGMSNGGFMSYRLACQMSDRIAAIASVTGSMSPEDFESCDPERAVPVLEIHGTSDAVIPYNGIFYSTALPNVLDFWIAHNGVTVDEEGFDMPDTNTEDGSTVKYFLNSGGENGTVVEHFRIDNGAHTWPGTIFEQPGTNYDIDASAEIWRFFNEHDLDGKRDVTATDNLEGHNIAIYPNPTSGKIYLETSNYINKEYILYTIDGQVAKKSFLNHSNEIDLTNLNAGMYILSIDQLKQRIVKL